ncbi:MAG TPA: hypothetical protein VFE47_22085 [Tepidisphaeraceae bacterium]|jgi:hypothetical protein|nr:hypothetical protein [Tepidisphaeraceae bacterium]
MGAEIRVQTQVLPGHRIEFTAAELAVGSAVDVMVILREQNDELSPLDMLRMPLEERNKLLESQAERLAEYYESTASEREEWQGGDIVEY